MKTRPTATSPRAGFALILVMITIFSLTLIVASFAISMKTEMRLARNSDYDAEMEWMGRTGVELARFALANKSPEQRNIDALNQFWNTGRSSGSNDVGEIISLRHQPCGTGFIDINIVDMERKWDINLVAGAMRGPPQREVLQKALNTIGVTDAGLASTIEDSIIAWCSPMGASGLSGGKDDDYARLNPPYYCKHGQIDDLSELLLIKGVTPEIYFGSNASNHPVSAYQQHGGGPFDQPSGGNGVRSMHGNNDEPVYQYGLTNLFSPMGQRLNINTASALALSLIPGVDENSAQRFISDRDGPDHVEGTDDDAPCQNVGEFIANYLGPNGMGGGRGQPNMPIPNQPNLQNQPGQPNQLPPGAQGPQGPAAYIDVRSYVFDVIVVAEINGYKRTFHGIVSRQGGNNAQQMSCVKFYWE